MGGGLSAPAAIAASLVLCVALAGCSRAEPPKRYVLQGQVLAVHPERRQITIKHEDIVGFMPGMTMAFEVADAKLLEGRTPGDLVTAELEVSHSLGRLTSIVTTGTAPLPADGNQAALAAGILDVGDAIPDAALIDQQDRRRTLAEWAGTPALMTFVYTRCPLPTFCPLMDQNFATIQRHAAEDATLRGRIRLVSISFDPEHDTPAVLAAHAAKLKADPAVWTFLTGDRVTVDRLAGKFGVGLLRGDQTKEEIIHNLRTFLIGPDGRVVKIYGGSDWTTSQVLADLRALTAAPQ
jgi:protein SCO1/2